MIRFFIFYFQITPFVVLYFFSLCMGNFFTGEGLESPSIEGELSSARSDSRTTGVKLLDRDSNPVVGVLKQCPQCWFIQITHFMRAYIEF